MLDAVGARSVCEASHVEQRGVPYTLVVGQCFAAMAAARRAHVGTNASGIVVVAIMVRVVFVILCSARGRFALSGTSLRDRTW